MVTDVRIIKYIHSHLHNGKSLGPLMDFSYVVWVL